MSELREKLHKSRREYVTARYPGNLAVDILWNGSALRPVERLVLHPRPPRWRVVLGWGLGLIGAAAVISMFLWLERTPPAPQRQWTARRPSVNTLLQVPEKPPLPESVRLVPRGHVAAPARPPDTLLRQSLTVPGRPVTPVAVNQLLTQ
jgi:hypothetical protein